MTIKNIGLLKHLEGILRHTADQIDLTSSIPGISGTTVQASLENVGSTLESVISMGTSSIASYASTTALRAAVGTTGQLASLSGYFNASDGGGGNFIWDTTVVADDGGTVLNSGGYGVSSAGWRRIYSGAIDVQWFGANVSTDASTAITRADATAQRLGLPLKFTPNTQLVNGSYSITSNISVLSDIIALGGRFLPSSGKKVTIAGAIDAPEDEIIFDTSSGGTFSITWNGPVHALWWAGNDVGLRWNTMIASCFSETSNHRSTTGPYEFKLRGLHTTTTPFDCTAINPTGLAPKITFDFTGSHIKCKTAMEALMDFTGSNTVTVQNLSIEGQQSSGLDVVKNGILLARDENTNPASPANAAHNKFHGAMVIGYFSRAALHNCGSEVDEFFDCWFENDSTTAPYCIYLTHTNDDEHVTSPFGRTPGNGTPSPTTSTGINFYGLRAYAPYVTAGAIYNRAFANINMPDPFVVSSIASHLVFDADGYGIVGFYSTGFYPHPVNGVYPTSCIKFTGTNTVERIFLRMRTVACTTNAFEFTGANTISQSTFDWTTADTFEGTAVLSWTDCDIIARGSLDPQINLNTSGAFTGTIRCGRPAHLLMPGQTVGSEASTRAIVQYTLNDFQNVEIWGGPVQNRRTAAPTLANRKGLTWISNGTAISGLKDLANNSATAGEGDLIYTYVTGGGATKNIQLFDYSVDVAIGSFSTVTALRAFTGISGQRVTLTGFSTLHDGGEGTFIWDTTSRADDGGTILNSGGLGSSSAGWRRIFSGPMDVRWFGAVADGLTNSHDALFNANASGNSHNLPILLTGGDFAVSSSLTLSAPLVFDANSSLIPGSSATIIITGEITAPDSVAIFDSSAGGAFAITSNQKMNARWWTGATIGDQWNAMVDSCRGLGPTHFYATGTYLGSGAFDLTQFTDCEFDFTGLDVTFGDGYSSAIDMTGSNNCLVFGGHFRGKTSTTTKVGLLLSRDQATNPASPSPAARHSFFHVTFEGHWATAALYNIGSEVNHFFGGRFQNQHATGKYVAYLTTQNNDSITSPFGVTPGNGTPTNTTASGQEFFGTRFDGAATGQSVSAGAVYINGFAYVSLRDCFIVANNFATPDAQHVVIDTTQAPSTTLYGICLDQIWTHPDGSGNKPDYSIKIIGNGILDGFRLDPRAINSATRAVWLDGSTTLRSSKLWLKDANGFQGDTNSKVRSCEFVISGDNVTPLVFGLQATGTIVGGDPTNITQATSVWRMHMLHDSNDGGFDPALSLVRMTRGADLTDANANIAITSGTHRTLPHNTLSTDRSLTINTNSAIDGHEITITRLDSSPYTYSIINGGASGGTIVILPASEASFMKAVFDGSDWLAKDVGSLGDGYASTKRIFTKEPASATGASVSTTIVSAGGFTGSKNHVITAVVHAFDGTDYADFKLTARFNSDGPGNATALTSIATDILYKSGGATAWTAAIAVSSGSLVMQGSGATAGTVWTTNTEFSRGA